MSSTEREAIENNKISNENIRPNHSDTAPSGIVENKDDPSADALGKAKKLAKLGSKIFDRNSLKANEGSVLRETKLLGLSDRDIRELMNISEKGYTTSPAVRGKTAVKDRKQVTLSDVSRQLERQSAQIERVSQILQPLQKQTKLVQRQPESIKQMSSQIKHIQEQISQIQKSIDKITKTQWSTVESKGTMEQKDSEALQNSDRSTKLKIKYINSKTQTERFSFEQAKSIVFTQYNNLEIRLNQVIQDQNVKLLKDVHLSTPKTVDVLISNGYLPEKAKGYFDIISEIRNKVAHGEPITDDEFEEYILACLKFENHLDKTLRSNE